MDFALLTITGISLLLAAATGLALLKMLRDERARSEARVALLSAAARAVDRRAPQQAPPADETWGSVTDVSGARHLFTVPDTPATWGSRLAIAGGIFLFGAAVLALLPAGSEEPDRAARPALELLVLGHTQRAGELTVKGIVQNPRSAPPLSRVAVSATVYGGDGRLVGGGRAGLGHAMLRPGDESPFVINVPVEGAVSRYRIGFRTQDGSIIAHVDRRSDPASARNEGNAGIEPWVP